MSQHLRTLPALLEDLASTPDTQVRWLMAKGIWHPFLNSTGIQIHVVYTHTGKPIGMHINKTNNNF